MTSRLNTKISEFLNRAQLILNNTLTDEEILGYVSQFGFDNKKLNEGLQRYERAVEAYNIRQRLKGNQQNLTEEFYKAYKNAQNAYQNLAKVARAIFQNDKGKLAQLGLNKRMPRTISQFITNAYTLFDNVLSIEDIKTKLSEFGFNEERINSERQKIVELDIAKLKKESAKGAAQQATKDQEQAFYELSRWISTYIKIARVALQGRKELLEKLGIQVKRKASRKNNALEKLS